MSDPAVIVRDATLADLPRIVELIDNGRPEGAPSGEDRTSPLAQSYLHAFAAIESNPGHRLLVGELAGTVVATFSLAILANFAHRGRPVAQLESFHVDATLRSTGVGGVMLQWAIAEARSANCVRLQLTSNKSRTRAHAFYRRYGFVASHEGMKLAL